jgi:hypothetical protein
MPQLLVVGLWAEAGSVFERPMAIAEVTIAREQVAAHDEGGDGRYGSGPALAGVARVKGFSLAVRIGPPWRNCSITAHRSPFLGGIARCVRQGGGRAFMGLGR